MTTDYEIRLAAFEYLTDSTNQYTTQTQSITKQEHIFYEFSVNMNSLIKSLNGCNIRISLCV